MRDYARRQTAQLTKRLEQAVNRAAKELNADAIHDLRVAMRRLSRCLRAFSAFYPDGYWKKIRRRISALMAAAGAVRDCDIAIELMTRARLAGGSAVVKQLQNQRRKAAHDLMLEVRRWKNRELLHKWSSRLEL